MTRVVITGVDLITALGPDLASTWPRLLAGDTGIGPITYFDSSQYGCSVAAQVPDWTLDDTGVGDIPVSHCRRGVRLFLKTARSAWRDAGLQDDASAREHAGVAAGVSVNYVNMRMVRHHHAFRRAGTMDVDLDRFAREGGCQPPSLFHRRQGELAATLPARALGLRGPSISIDTACAASAFAIGEAYRAIRRGRARLMVAGGGASLVSPVGILAFSVLGALSRNPDPLQASRPFDRCRDGFVMGEGAGAVVLEEFEHARARGARIYAELCGYGVTLSGHNLTDPSPDGACEEQAMRLAVAEAQLPPEAVGYVAAHGTSTQKNDATETAAIKSLFGAHARRLAVSSNKGQIGHTISAAGVCNVICAVKAVSEGWVPPTAHYQTPDPACDLDYVPNVGRRMDVEAALANAFAFGGQNASLALRRA
jgi:3-oxoacyl-[acyl-carrier-protein] synthase II